MRWSLPVFVAAELAALALVVWLGRRRWQQRRARLESGRRGARSRRSAVGLVGAFVLALFVVPVGGSAYALGDCKDAPRVERPTDGLVATIDGKVGDTTGPISPAQGTAGTPYGDYGYAGMTWQTYDLGCGGDARDPVTASTTWAANQVFSVAKLEVALFNGLHYALLDNGSFDWLDKLTSGIGATLFSGIFAPWIGLVLLILAVLLFGYAARSDLAGLSRRASWGVIALTFAAATAATPLVFESFVRSTVVDLSNDASNGLVKSEQGRNGVPDYLVNRVIYPAWQKGQFGATDNKAAQDYSAKLLAAKACSKDENRTGCGTSAKSKQFGTVADDIKSKSGDNGDAYHVLQGRNDVRLSSAGQALLSATIATSFQVVALIILALSILTVALMVLLGGVVGLLAVLNPDTMRGVFRVFGTALINAVIMAVFAGLHARIVLWVTGQSGIPWILQEVGLALVTVLMLMVAQPFKRAKTMLSAVLNTVGGTSSTSGLLGRRGSDRAAAASDEYWQRQRQNEFAESTPTGPAHVRDASVPEEHVNSIGHLESFSVAALGRDGGQPQSSGSRAVGWAQNVAPQARAAVMAAQVGRELTGSLAELSRPEPAAEVPSVGEGSTPAAPGRPALPTDRSAEDWYRPDPEEQVPDAAPAVQSRDGQSFTITEAPPAEEPYVPAGSEPAELNGMAETGRR